ncbi:MAG TPA: hypothetical protein PLL10_05145, partial [Elusimicrobiales bacterium]|nr:hypothetical protein [Elusimicrobiales bacterium]
GKYYFAAAFSRERVHLAPPGHQYVSFNQARDAFIWALDAKTEYKLSAFAELGNLVIASTQACTGDHDGVAAILETAGS